MTPSDEHTHPEPSERREVIVKKVCAKCRTSLIIQAYDHQEAIKCPLCGEMVPVK